MKICNLTNGTQKVRGCDKGGSRAIVVRKNVRVFESIRFRDEERRFEKDPRVECNKSAARYLRAAEYEPSRSESECEILSRHPYSGSGCDCCTIDLPPVAGDRGPVNRSRPVPYD